MDRPQNARYTKSHEWAVLEDGVLTLGITDFAAEALGDIVFVDLPDVGAEFAAGENCCEIESVKAVGEVYCPVAGTVAEVNGALADDPSGLGADPFGGGWLIKVTVADDGPLADLMDVAAYEKHLETADPD